jgi:hypothetical protein
LEAERRCAMGDPTFAVAQELGLSPDALYRHLKNHVAPTTRALSAARAAAEGATVVLLPPSKAGGQPKPVVPDLPTLTGVARDLQRLKARAEQLLTDAEQEGAIHGRIGATSALLATLDRLARVAALLAPPSPSLPARPEVDPVALSGALAEVVAVEVGRHLDAAGRRRLAARLLEAARAVA